MLYTFTLFMTLNTFSLDASAAVEVINLVPQQLAKQAVTNKRDANFLVELGNFCGSNDWNSSVDLFQAQATAIGQKNCGKTADRLEYLAKMLSKKIGSKLQTSSLKPVSIYIIIGCGKTDAFALTTKEEVFVFFDIFTLLKQNRSEFINASFVAHELIHGYHFAERAEYSPGNYTTAEDKLLKYLVAEGMASYLSGVLSGEDQKAAFWGDVLNQGQFLKWKQYAELNKKTFARRMEKYLKKPESEPDLLKDLFYVTEMAGLESKRAGYFYGYKIVETHFKSNKLSLDIDIAAIRPTIREYFGLNLK